jgi:hypothetical protein
MSTPQASRPVPVHLDGLQGKPHGEVVIIKRDAEGMGAIGVCYNTLSLPDHMSDEAFHALDAEALKAEFGGDGVWLNGPRRAQMDEATADVFDDGEITLLGSIPMQVVGYVHIPDVRVFAGQRPVYAETSVERTTVWVFKAGRKVHELVAPSGHVYVMQSASLINDPDMSEHAAADLGDRLQIPEGWTYRWRMLDEDLVVRAEDGMAHIVLDEYENNYQRED